jgi:hypothetical protein
MDARRRCRALLVSHLLAAPLVGAVVYRRARDQGHPAPARAALRYGALGVPGLVLYERRTPRDSW